MAKETKKFKKTKQKKRIRLSIDSEGILSNFYFSILYISIPEVNKKIYSTLLMDYIHGDKVIGHRSQYSRGAGPSEVENIVAPNVGPLTSAFVRGAFF